MSRISLPGNFKKAVKSYVVGLDGSETSMQAVQMAAQSMQDLHDNLIIVTLGRKGNSKDQEVFDRSKSKATEVATKNHIPIFRIYTLFVEIESTDTFDRALCSIANTHANGSCILVMGAAGKGDEDRTGRRAVGQPPMGSIALGCLQRCKVPVLLVKTGPRIDLDVPRIKRQGRDSTPGLNIAVSMDDSPISARAFDMACKVATRLDTLYVYHVQVPNQETAPLMNELRLACDKLMDGKSVQHAAVITEPRGNKAVRDLIEQFVDVKAIDLLFMGSGEQSPAGQRLACLARPKLNS
jgi:nucleotide-binding universal stress UspA family protein